MGETSGSNSILPKLECPLCKTTYTIGDNAGLVTLNDFAREITSRGGKMLSPMQPETSSDPALVGMFPTTLSTTEKKDRAKKALANVERVKKALKAGHTQYWYCQKCKNSDNPHEYPDEFKYSKIKKAKKYRWWHLLSNNPTKKFETTRRKALKGNVKSQNNLGSMYTKGEGCIQDYQKAIIWYRKAAEERDRLAQHNIGDLYYFGQGVEHNDTLAAEWYLKSAEQGYEQAQLKIAVLYANGRGVPIDIAESLRWLQKAADNGNTVALEKLQEVDSHIPNK